MTPLPRRRLLVASLALAPWLALAGERKSTRKKGAKARSLPSDSSESPADRARRFQRECRGQPNAGACAGYGYGS